MLDIVATDQPLLHDPRVADQTMHRWYIEHFGENEKEIEAKAECVCGSCLSDGSESDEMSLG